jgi:hypothetical protein
MFVKIVSIKCLKDARNNMKILGIGSTFEFQGRVQTVLKIVKNVDASGSYYHVITDRGVIPIEQMEKILNI